MCENGVCRRIPNDASSSSQQLSTEDKVEKAKELIEKKREQKQLEEKEVIAVHKVLYIYRFNSYI